MRRALGLLLRPPPRIAAAAAILLISVLGVYIYAGYVEKLYPIKDWLVWPLSAIWGYTALANLAWFSIGSLVVGRVLGLRDLPTLETAVLSAAVGLVVFTELMYLAGVLGLYGPVFAVVLPLTLILAGAPELVRWWLRYKEESAARRPAGPGLLALWGMGAVLTAILYLGLLSPDAINYDATWCHLTIAQDYAREGRIVPFPGDYSKNVPQLASLVHTWDFSVPGLSSPPLRWMLALHQEFGLFLWTLAGVAAAIRFMVRDQKLRGCWVAFYLFPIIFVYDHNMGGAADHVAAFFALPGLLAAGRLLEKLDWRRAMAMALCMAGGFLTKYQAFYWIVPLLLVVGVRWLLYAIAQFRRPAVGDDRLLRAEAAEGRRNVWLVPLVAGLGFTLLVAPHFLKNWVFYRNPVYPFMQQAFSGTRPTVDNVSFLFSNIFTDVAWVPKGTFVEKLKHALRLAFTFSFEPHYSFTKNFPVFGSLFTLLLPALLFVRERRYKLLGAFVGFVTLLIWGVTFNVDRNLQVFLPILAATTGATLVGIYQLGWLARLAVAPLLLFQIVWGADAVFYSSHDRIKSSMDLIRSGFEGGAKKRFDSYRSTFVALGKALPPDATVLLHSSHVSLGIDRRVVLDWAGFQGLVSYSKVRNTRELFKLYRGLGITHILYVHGERAASSIQEEIVFQSFVGLLGRPVSTVGGFRLLRLPSRPPAAEPAYQVLTLDLYGYGSGVFPIEHLNTNEYIAPAKRVYKLPSAPAPTEAAELEALDVAAVVVGATARPNPAQADFLSKHFAVAVQLSGQQSVYLRKTRPKRGR